MSSFEMMMSDDPKIRAQGMAIRGYANVTGHECFKCGTKVEYEEPRTLADSYCRVCYQEGLPEPEFVPLENR